MKTIAVTGNGAGGFDYRIVPDSSLLLRGKPLFLPEIDGEFRLIPALVVRIGRLGKAIAPRFVVRHCDGMGVGLLVAVRDPATGCDAFMDFDGQAVCSDFKAETTPESMHFTVKTRCGEVFTWRPEQLPADVDTTISELSRLMTMKTGDLFYFCAPASIPVRLGDRVEVTLHGSEEPFLAFNVR